MTQKKTETAGATSSFESVLTEIIRLSRELMPGLDAEGAPVAGAETNRARQAAEITGQRRLQQALGALDIETALKLRTLMIAGRDGQDIWSVRVNMRAEDADAAFSAAARDASDSGPLLADYLQRGHALACAASLDLERPLAMWGSDAPDALDERAWLRFGRLLASSQMDDWQCFGFLDPGGQNICRLYVRQGDHAWWSFTSVLDRPSAVLVTKEQQLLSRRRTRGIQVMSLKALAARLAKAADGAAPAARESGTPAAPRQGRALRRATRAIRARVGPIAAVAVAVAVAGVAGSASVSSRVEASRGDYR